MTKPKNFSKVRTSSKYVIPNKNWEVGVKNKIILAGPMPIILKPKVYKKRGTKVIKPDQNK